MIRPKTSFGGGLAVILTVPRTTPPHPSGHRYWLIWFWFLARPLSTFGHPSVLPQDPGAPSLQGPKATWAPVPGVHVPLRVCFPAAFLDGS